MLDKDKLKNEILTIEDVYSLVSYLGGNPRPILDNNSFISQTICHNGPNKGSYKLYYYQNTHGFYCYSDCGYLDIYQLVQKVKKVETGEEWGLGKAVFFVASFFNLTTEIEDFSEEWKSLQDWKILSKYEANKQEKKSKNIVELKKYDDNFLKFYPLPHIRPWEKEGITYDSMVHHNIKYNPVSGGIIIPHYDIDNNLVGVRERTLVTENEIYGKYRPAVINGKMYNHPLGFTLYNINNSKDNIKYAKKVIIFESEKSTLKYESYFGKECDISVAVCGSSLTFYQFKELYDLGIDELIIAFDREGEKDNKTNYVKKFYEFDKKYSPYTKVSFIFDKDGEYLDYKDSPVDKGKDIFIELFNQRIFI